MALATFLRARRARLHPDLGGKVDRRRRTQGLRREEVALAAGISVAWYTSLEQGRELGVSANTLNRLAKSLQLSSDERQYMFALAGVDPGGEVTEEAARGKYSIALLNALGQLPSYVYDYMWNICDWNLAADTIYHLSEFGTEDRNGLIYMFLNPRARHLIVNWEVEARRMLAKFRLSIGSRLGDPEIEQLVDRLTARSPQFASWWATSDDVLAERPQRKKLEHPVFGGLMFEYLTCHVCDDRSFRVVVNRPLDDGTTAKLDALMRRIDPASATVGRPLTPVEQRLAPGRMPASRRGGD